MRRFLMVALLMMSAFSPAALGQSGDKRTAQDRKAEEAIRALERQWLIEPYFTGDMTAYDRIVADNFTITHSDGQVLNKAEKRANIIDGRITDPSSPFGIGESAVRVYGNAAVSIGHITERNSIVRFTNTYVKRGGRWQVVASQLNRIRRQ